MNDLLEKIESVAAEIDRDERTIKDSLIVAIETGQNDFALQVLSDWCKSSPRDVVQTHLENSDGPTK